MSTLFAFDRCCLRFLFAGLEGRVFWLGGLSRVALGDEGVWDFWETS